MKVRLRPWANRAALLARCGSRAVMRAEDVPVVPRRKLRQGFVEVRRDRPILGSAETNAAEPPLVTLGPTIEQPVEPRLQIGGGLEQHLRAGRRVSHRRVRPRRREPVLPPA